MNKKNLFKRLIPLLAVIGPGIISGSVDNDAGGIATYSIAGAQFGYSLLWVLFVTTFSLVVTQEIGARMGIVTGKGLGALIREKFGVRWTFFTMLVLLISNIGTIAAEFAGVAAAFEILNVSRVISIPITCVIVLAMVIEGNFRTLEKLFLVVSAFYAVYIVSAVLAHPHWGLGLTSLVVPTFRFDKSFLITLVAVIGTTITPWGQFFIQDYVVDKNLSKKELNAERADVFAGSFITNFISFFIIVACAATIFSHGLSINNAKDAAIALKPLAGNLASFLFGFGLLNASVFGAALVPVSTSYVITDSFGFGSGLNHSFKQAPQFYVLFAGSLIVGALLVLIPFVPLLSILFWTQALDAVLLLPILVFVFLLSNDLNIMKEYKNGKIVNIIVIITFLLIALSTLAYIISQFIH